MVPSGGESASADGGSLGSKELFLGDGGALVPGKAPPDGGISYFTGGEYRTAGGGGGKYSRLAEGMLASITSSPPTELFLGGEAPGGNKAGTGLGFGGGEGGRVLF